MHYDHRKENPISMDGGQTEELTFDNGQETVWVEWAAQTHGFANLSLFNTATQQTMDVVRFHSFHSLIVAFGGNGQNPQDTDGDGSIGDVAGEEGDDPNNREGIFDVAQQMYNTGWDVQAFNEEIVDDPAQIPQYEVWSAHNERFIDFHAVMGFSQGGGATHDLIEASWDGDANTNGDPDRIFTRLGIFVDAVNHDANDPVTDYAELTIHTLNFYSLIVEFPPPNFDGAMIDTFDMPDFVTHEQFDVSDEDANPQFDNTLDHYSIDDDPLVQSMIRAALLEYLVLR